MTPEVIPWMSPCLSQSMSFVLAGIGHPMKFRRGDVIYTSPGLFGNLMYVRSGFVVKALLDPVRDEPLLLSMAGPGALCGNYENLYVRDRMPRRHWCLTSTEVLVVNQELLLKIATRIPSGSTSCRDTPPSRRSATGWVCFSIIPARSRSASAHYYC